MIVYCLLPAPEKNPGRCSPPKNHSELYNFFARNVSQHGEHGNITHEALDEILDKINSTIGKHLTKKKVREKNLNLMCFLFFFVQKMLRTKLNVAVLKVLSVFDRFKT